MIIELNPNNNIEELFAKYKKVIIDIYATWCGPCKMLAPQIENFAQANKDWTIIKVDCDQNPNVTAMFNVQAVPTMVFIIDKKVVEKVMGFKPLSEIEKITNKY